MNARFYKRGDGVVFEANPDTLHEKEMIKSGFVRVANLDGDPYEPEAGETIEPVDDGLDKKSIPELRPIAAAAGVEKVGSMNKGELVAAIR